MRSLLLVPLVFSVGCLNESYEYDLGQGGGGGGGGGNGYAPPTLTTTLTTDGVPATAWTYPVAVGGSTFVAAWRGSFIGVAVHQDSPAFTLTDAPAETGTTGYVLTASEAASTTLVMTALNYADQSRDISAYPVDEIRFVPRTLPNHRSRGGAVAWHTSMREAVIELTARTSPHPTRLVDISTDLFWASVDDIEMTAWDLVTLPLTPGEYNLIVKADSFGQRQFPFFLADRIDRIEPVVTGALERVGDEAEVCFHAMLGEREVVLPIAFELGGYGDLVAVGTPPASNCRRVRASVAGTSQVDGTALDQRASLVFTIAP